jgi:hypothetical protein
MTNHYKINQIKEWARKLEIFKDPDYLEDFLEDLRLKLITYHQEIEDKLWASELDDEDFCDIESETTKTLREKLEKIGERLGVVCELIEEANYPAVKSNREVMFEN